MNFRSVFAIDLDKLFPLCVLGREIQLFGLPKSELCGWELSSAVREFVPNLLGEGRGRVYPGFQFGSYLTQALLKLQPQLICLYKYIGTQYGSYSSKYRNNL